MKYEEETFISDTNGVKDILRLSFCDADRLYGTDVYGREAQNVITREDAKAIREFIENHRGIDIVIVHCDAGISRSAGVAAGILAGTIGDDTQIFDNHSYYPNMLCYRTVLEEFMTVYAKWITSKYYGYLVCSNCKDCYIEEDWISENSGKWSHCPSCGATMIYDKLEVVNNE